jgi:small basic protein (TIGR04137 family)
MSIDRTLHMTSGVTSKRNVLKRSERIAVMTEAGTFDPEKDNPLGIPKTRVKHSKAGQKAKKVEEKEDDKKKKK